MLVDAPQISTTRRRRVFTHYCGWTRDGRLIVKRKTQSKRLTRKRKALRQDAWRHMRSPVAEQHRWLSSVLRGHSLRASLI
jgi:hypothetical protein